MTASTARAGHHRTLSRWMLGLVFMLLFLSHIAVPCAITIGRGFTARGGMCRADKYARPATNTNQYFLAPMPKTTEFAAALTLVWLASVAVLVPILSRPSRFPLAVSARGRPFVSSDPPHLAYFGAQRDA